MAGIARYRTRTLVMPIGAVTGYYARFSDAYPGGQFRVDATSTMPTIEQCSDVIETQAYRLKSPDARSQSNDSRQLRRKGKWISTPPVHPLNLSRRCFHALLMTGQKYQGSNLVFVYENYPTQLYEVRDPHSKYPAMTAGDLLGLTTQLLAKSNPSAPSVSTPSFVGELGEVPGQLANIFGNFLKKGELIGAIRGRKSAVQSLVKGHRSVTNVSVKDAWLSLAKSVPGDVATGNLTWKWGIAPFAGDVASMMGFQEDYKRRLGYLEKLRSSGSLRRKVKLRESSEMEASSELIIESAEALVLARRNTMFRQRVWGTVRYRLPVTTVLPPYLKDPRAMQRKALQITFGMTDFELLQSAWNLTPWSWLGDWFGHYGQSLTALNNSLDLIADNLCIMVHTSSTEGWDVTECPDWVKLVHPRTAVAETKRRYVGMLALPLPYWSIPVMSGHKLSILGSLAVLKAPR